MSELIQFRRYRVSVEVATPAEDWLTRLMEPNDGCAHCGGPLPDPPIHLSTEGRGASGGDLLCSWGCVLELSAGVVLVDEEVREYTTIEELPDWRGQSDG